MPSPGPPRKRGPRLKDKNHDREKGVRPRSGVVMKRGVPPHHGQGGGDGLPISGLGLVCPLGVGAAPSVWAVWVGGGDFASPPLFSLSVAL